MNLTLSNFTNALSKNWHKKQPLVPSRCFPQSIHLDGLKRRGCAHGVRYSVFASFVFCLSSVLLAIPCLGMVLCWNGVLACVGKKVRQDLSRNICILVGVPTWSPKRSVWQIRFGLVPREDYLKTITLPETNIAPGNGWLEYQFPFGMAYFQRSW